MFLYRKEMKLTRGPGLKLLYLYLVKMARLATVLMLFSIYYLALVAAADIDTFAELACLLGDYDKDFVKTLGGCAYV